MKAIYLYSKAFTLPGSELFNVPRGDGNSRGGIAVLYKESIKVVSKSLNLGGQKHQER